MSMMNLSAKASILDYWRAVELFSPQKVPRAAPNDYNEPVFTAGPDIPIPWDPSHPLKSRGIPPLTSRRFLVYCGIFSLEKVRAILEDHLGKDPESFDERSDGESCLFAFSVTDDGRPLFDTFVLSTCAWATARTLAPGSDSADWLTGFDITAETIARDFAERYAIRQDNELGKALEGKDFKLGRPIDYADILLATERIAQQLGVANLSNPVEIRIKAGLVASSKKYSADDQDFLNSFFVKDLGKVAAEVRNNNFGKGLAGFLSGDAEIDIFKRIDVSKSIDTLFKQLSPALFPAGRWPSQNHYPLVFGQQFAVNSMVQNLLQGAGLFAVNGPPGTGKTTLLRDLIAAVVVERAKCLSELARPEYAFAGETRWKTNEYNRVISNWKEKFKSFEIVVASYNNKAVENVTQEIPVRETIDSSWLGHTDYFPDLATRFIDEPDKRAWAMVAARLGNKANRNDFISRFWYGNKEAKGINEAEPSATGFLDLLKTFEKQATDWEQAVSHFKTALADEQRLRQERHRIYTHLKSFFLIDELQALETKLKELESYREPATHLLQTAQVTESYLTDEVESARRRRLEHRQFRPGILEIILTFGKAFREWRQKDKAMQALIEMAEHKVTKAKKETIYQLREIELLEKKFQHTTSLLEQKRKLLAETYEKLDSGKDQLGPHFPMLETWNNKEEARELSSPWADPIWNHARARVFLEALQLHKAFIVANAGIMRKNLQGAMDILTGAVPNSAPAEGIEAAWTTLFFVIPVISTTFASFDRLFSHLGRESIGWLLIDEAGQAMPQAAAGAIWRAKRSVVVGDPLQLEPVITIPFTVQQALRRYYQVDDTWVPERTSVQQLADRVSRFGTYITGQDDPIWVGSPLRVHRRCDQPMFDISNRVAYEGFMVFGTPARPTLNLPLSRWIDVESMDSEGHWIPAEGEAVGKLINDLISRGVQAEDIVLISPFRAVVKQLHRFAKSVRGIQTGTIHTVQGKESDIVILVLGGDPRRPGAKKWASARPNLLNVAASRAKRRLFVIGNKGAWKQYRYFSTCASLLERFNNEQT